MSLQARSLACLHGDRPIFIDVDFRLDEGAVLQVGGRNGVGKSSLLRILCGFATPAKGEARWNSLVIHDNLPEYHSDMHFVGHKNAIKDSLKLIENLRFWAALGSNNTPLQQARQVDEALDRFQLRALADVPARLLSSGQRRRLALARLLTQERKLWLLDEPSVGLDQNSVSKLEILIEDHRRNGGTVVVVTHTRLTLLKSQKLDMDKFRPADRDLGAFMNSVDRKVM